MARGLLSKMASPFSFSTNPVTVLAVLIYAVVFSLVLTNDTTAEVPKKTKGLQLDQAYDDLHRITSRPHPFISHENDDVHKYITARLKNITDGHGFAHLSVDIASDASWVSPARATTSLHGTYFEATNILVKIDGTDAPQADSGERPDGVLFSAHYDSVSTAPGATDDGMGIVTMISFIEYLSQPEYRPRKTAVFFFNNGEEDGLNGAYTYWKHPWSNLTSTFINLEGAASGGQPLVFRATDGGVASSFLSRGISHPHAEVTCADAYKSGVVRSYTDYEVYERGLKGRTAGMAGVDYAFYKNRAYYHTPMDSIPGMGYKESRRSLWAMMEGTRGAGLSLLNGDSVADDGDTGVYFDLFKYKLILLPLSIVYILNVVLLAVGPVLVIALLGWVLIASHKPNNTPEHTDGTTRWQKTKKVSAVIIGWGRFWIAIIVGIVAEVGLVIGFAKTNPYIVHGHPFLVLTTFLALSYLAIVSPLQVLDVVLPSSPVSQKLAVSLELYFLTWIFLIFSTAIISSRGIGALYWVTAWNICALIVCSISLIEGALNELRHPDIGSKAGLDLSVEDEDSSVPERRLVTGVLYEAPENQEAGESEEADVVETEPTEITPLMRQHRSRTPSGRDIVTVNGALDDDALEAKYGEHGWWILQLLVSVPIVATLLFQLQVLVLHALSNTLVDGSSPWTVYEGIAALSLLIFIPLTPFAHKLHGGLTAAVAIVFLLTLTASWTAFSFTFERPFKVFFKQSVELASPTGTLPNVTHVPGSIVRAETTLSGLQGYVDKYIVPELPSSWDKDVQCSEDASVRPNLLTCRWEGGLLPAPGAEVETESDTTDIRDTKLLAYSPPSMLSDWLTFTIARTNTSRAHVTLGGHNTRACRLYFDRPVTYYAVRGASDGAGQLPGYEIPAAGIRELHLWSREWDRVFDVDVGWEGDVGSEGAFDGRAACEWAEYASGTAGGTGSTPGGRIPAFEEVKMFLPTWALPTKAMDGLVEVWTRYSV